MPHTLRTANLLLRRPELRDAKALAAVFRSREAARMTKTWPHPVTEAHAAFRIREWHKSMALGDIGFVILSGRSLIGSIGVTALWGNAWSIGYGINPDWWGKGVATESVRAVCEHTFRVRQASLIKADVFQENPSSSRVLCKTGFKCIGDIGPGWSTVEQCNLPRWGYELTKESLIAHAAPSFDRATTP